MPIIYRIGDATQPSRGDGTKIIAHIVNDRGGWGRGFVSALSKRYQGPERWYRQWARGKHPESGPFKLGAIQVVPVLPDLCVANLLAQHGYRSVENPIPLNYLALRRCLVQLADIAERDGASVHCPRLGAGLAGGNWSQIEALLETHLLTRGIPVTIYDLHHASNDPGSAEP